MLKKLYFLFCLMIGGGAIGISGAHICFAHDFDVVTNHGGSAKEAKDVEVGDEAAMRELFDHWKEHSGKATDLDEGIPYLEEYSREGGPFYSGSVYGIIVDLEGRSIMHARYIAIGKSGGNVYGIKDDNDKAVVQELIDKATADAQGEVVCVDYVYKSVDRVSCAIEYYDKVTNADRVFIFGFDHVEDDAGVTYLPCPEPSPSVTAAQVVDKDTLQAFVKDALKYTLGLLAATGGDQAKAANYRHCFRKEPWISGNIYMFAMTSKTLVFFNGLDPSLEGTNLYVVDSDGVNIGEEIIKTASGTGIGGFVEYRWDDPSEEGDEVRDEYGNPIPGKTPGNSRKISYVEGLSFGGDAVFIIGSGIYPEETVSGGDDDGGCAIAAQTADASRSAAANLLLVVSALFAAVSLRKRPAGKRM